MQNNSKRERQNRWDRKAMITCSCRVRKEVYDKFKAYCWLHDTTMHGLIKRFVTSLIEHAADEIGS